jgi:transcriptional regulator with GAF, ATPase, and Fis domain
MPLVKRTPMALEIDCRALTNRVTNSWTLALDWHVASELRPHSHDPCRGEAREDAVAKGFKSGCVLPLISRDRVVGVVHIGSLQAHVFTQDEVAFLMQVANQIAIAQKIGRFELAHQGTLFLDEIGDIPLDLQPKLLRVLQEQEFERLGSARTIRVDVRLVAATNRDLAQMVEEGKFREDLYYRLNVFPLPVLPLRERVEDIPLLVRHFAHTYAQRMRKRIDTIPAEALGALTSYHWPGNVRELQNIIERAVILTPDAVLRLPPAEWQRSRAVPDTPPDSRTLEEVEREHILQVLRETKGVIGGPQGAAARLGLRRTTLIYDVRMQKLGIPRRSP